MRINHLINGQSVASDRYFETVNPATQEVLAEVATGGAAEVNAAVQAAKDAFPAWAGLPATERAKKVRALGALIAQHVPEIARTETQDTGQVIAQTGKQLVPRAADNFHYFAEMCTRVDGHTYPTPTHLNYTLFHPVGVCALISPWNVPFMTATWKTAPCLAFGNTAVMKMSELSPLTANRLGELALEAGIPAGVFNVVQGFGDKAGDVRDASLKAPPGMDGIVIDIKVFSRREKDESTKAQEKKKIEKLRRDSKNERERIADVLVVPRVHGRALEQRREHERALAEYERCFTAALVSLGVKGWLRIEENTSKPCWVTGSSR